MNYRLAFVFLCFSVFSYAQENTDVASSENKLNLVRELSDSIAIEYAPSISADGKTIIFESNKNGPYKLFESVKDSNGRWTTPEPIEAINSFGDSSDLIGGPSLSFDGNTLFFFASIGRNSSSDIYYSTRSLEGWSSPINLGAPVNSKGYEAFPSISADGKTLYYVKQNEEGPSDKELRKMDIFCTSIYKSSKSPEGIWSKPIKLPAPINQDCEKAPKIMADGKTLIFSSNRPGGRGDYDMYQSKQNLLGEWLNAVPLNYVNSDKSDQLPSISASGDLMYFVYNNQDISTVVIPQELRQFMNNVIVGKITDRDSGEPISASVVITNSFTSEEIMVLNNNPATGAYSVVLPVGGSYNIQMLSEGFSSYTSAFDLRSVSEYRETNLDISLFKSIKLQVAVSDNELLEPIKSDIQILDAKGTEVYTGITDRVTGLSVIDLPLGKSYTVKISEDHYSPREFTIDVSGLVMYREFERDLDLTPEKVQVEINVNDLVTNGKVKSKIRLINRDRNEVIEVEGNQMVSLRAGDRYEVEVTSDQGYAFTSTTLDLEKGKVDEINLKLQKLEKDALLTLRDILFESNSSQLSDISFTELRRVIQLMKENPNLKVEVAAHTDDIGSDPYNKALSEKRAESVVQFMIDNQISEDRLVAKGYGESSPKVPNESDESRSVNRRVELKILGV